MAACPVCNTPIHEDFGLIECSNCGAQLLVHMDGRVVYSAPDEAKALVEDAAPGAVTAAKEVDAATHFAFDKPLEFDYDSSASPHPEPVEPTLPPQPKRKGKPAPAPAPPPPPEPTFVPAAEPPPLPDEFPNADENGFAPPEIPTEQPPEFERPIPEGDPDELVDFTIGGRNADGEEGDLDPTTALALTPEELGQGNATEYQPDPSSLPPIPEAEPAPAPADEDDPFLIEMAAATAAIPAQPEDEAPPAEDDFEPAAAEPESEPDATPDFFADEEAPAEPMQEAPRAPGSEDMSDIAQFGNSDASSARDGSLRYNLMISGIDTVDVRENFREAITDRKLIWDTDQIVRSIRNGEVRITNVSAAKAHIVVSRLRELPVQVQWEQYAIAQS